MNRILGAVVAAALLAGPAGAQLTETVSDDPVVEGLVVRAMNGGPAWWRVVDEDSIVYIMITPHTAPADLGWDASVLDFRLTGANVLITPIDFSLIDPRSIIGIGTIAAQSPKLLLAMKTKKPPKNPKPLESRLPDDVRAKFVALRSKIGQPAERYAQLTPTQAGGMIERDYRRTLGLTSGDDMGGPLQKYIESLARAKKVRIEAAYTMTIPAAKVSVETHGDPTAARSAQCLSTALDRMTVKGAYDVSWARAWARGEVAPLLKPVRFDPERDCRGAGGTISIGNDAIGRKLEEDYVAAQVRAIEKALKKPGHSVAVLEPLSPLGRADMGMLGTKGVLARLKAKGFEIRTPATVAD